MAGIISSLHTYWLIFPVFFEILTYAQENEINRFKDDNYCNTQDNKFQSPINIIAEDTIRVSYPALTQNLTQNSNAEIEVSNNGYTLNINLNDNAYLTGGPVRKTYLFENLHLHWGATNEDGSEHQFDSQTFPLEAHFVFDRTYQINIPLSCLTRIKQNFCNAKNKLKQEQCLDPKRLSAKFSKNLTVNCLSSLKNQYCSDTHRTTDTESYGVEVEKITTLHAERIAIKNAECQLKERLEAYENSGYICKKIINLIPYTRRTVSVKVVIGVLFQLSENAPNYRLLDLARDVVPVNATTVFPYNQLFEFVLNMRTNRYYTYSGSLTTPPYSENVIWVVLKDALLISAEQLSDLRNLDSQNGGKILQNFREVQDLENRVVYSTFN